MIYIFIFQNFHSLKSKHQTTNIDDGDFTKYINEPTMFHHSWKETDYKRETWILSPTFTKYYKIYDSLPPLVSDTNGEVLGSIIIGLK